jgi:hypothetical protein
MSDQLSFLDLPDPEPAKFDGQTYDPAQDKERLTSQLRRVWQVMSDGNWWTVAQIQRLTGDPSQSVQARLRDLRKDKFGSYLVETRRVTKSGLYEYRVGSKGEGTPEPRECARCKVLETFAKEATVIMNEAMDVAREENEVLHTIEAMCLGSGGEVARAILYLLHSPNKQATPSEGNEDGE